MKFTEVTLHNKVTENDIHELVIYENKLIDT